MAKKGKARLGVWAFLVGLIISIVVPFFGATYFATWVLVLGILGIIVGLLNITDSEISLYLIASITFMIAGSSLLTIWSHWYFDLFLKYVVSFVAPGAAIASLRALYDVAKH
ncbi:hypothetical protein JW968_00010 [Candidatus Woesearchaeota archaeon]|nr:hypothetical protein [Candidatus Woesearchaeota archaeon]